MTKKPERRRVAVRSGAGGQFGQTRVRVVYVHPNMLWLGAGENAGLAWVSGRKTLEAIRVAWRELRTTQAKDTP